MNHDEGDIKLDGNGLHFTFRVAAVGIHNDRVILQQITGTDWWFLPGGHGRIGETGEESLRREIREELDEEIEVERLLWIGENFFTLQERDFHEVSLVYLVTFPDGSHVTRRDEIPGIDGDDVAVINRWHALPRLNSLTLLPSFLREGIRNLPVAPVHITGREH